MTKFTLSGQALLNDCQQNKGTAFTLEERQELGLMGLLPPRVETVDEQCARCYQQYLTKPTALEKNLYLNDLLNHNEILFYELVSQHVEEMLPILYTPTVGQSIQQFHLHYKTPRGLFLSYLYRDQIDDILKSINREIDIILITDGERILGIGDQGIGGINICIGKLSVYTICAGIDPNRTLPIVLDVGTNNETLLNDPFYLGWRHERITGKEYDDFIDLCVTAIQKYFPHAILHWEDFARDTARKNLERYQNKMCTFNDDMQGTAAVTLAAIRSALQVSKQDITQQRIVFFGAGISATGISDLLVEYMIRQGLTRNEACSRIYLLGRKGLLLDDMPNLLSFQKPYAKSRESIANWQIKNSNKIELMEVIENVHPTILVGCSTVSGAFTEPMIKTMAQHVERPIIFPLSNPTANTEATPHDLLTWTNGKALIATGSPFPDEIINCKKTRIAQCNNLFIFPGLGLGLISAGTPRITNDMWLAASEALTQCCETKTDSTAPLLPSVAESRSISQKIARAVAGIKSDTF